MNWVFKKSLIAAILSIFVITSTHSIVLASEAASDQVGQAAAPNYYGLQQEILRTQILNFVRMAKMTGMYNGEEGKARFLGDFSKGMRTLKYIGKSQVASISDADAKARWDSIRLNAVAGTTAEARIDQMDQDASLSAKDKLTTLYASVSTKKLTAAMNAEIEKAGSVTAALDQVEAQVSQPGWSLKPSDIGIAVLFIVGVALIALLVWSIGSVIYQLGTQGYKMGGVLGAVLLPIGAIGGFILAEILLALFFQFLGDLASGKYDPKPAPVPAPAN